MAGAVPGTMDNGDASGMPLRSVSWTPGVPLDVISTCKQFVCKNIIGATYPEPCVQMMIAYETEAFVDQSVCNRTSCTERWTGLFGPERISTHISVMRVQQNCSAL